MKSRTKKIVKTLGIVVLTLMVLYVGSYVALSLGGRYEPGATGLNGVKYYRWTPCGFMKDYKVRPLPFYVYVPLCALDWHFWHTDQWGAYSGPYPVNEVKREDIWKVYKALP